MEFAKTVKSHTIKGSVSFEYNTTEVAPTTPVTPTVPAKPTDSVKPVKPVDTTKPVTPTKPVDTVKPTEPTKPVDTTKPTDPAKPVEKPTTPVGTQPKDEPTTPSTPTDNGAWKEETRTRIVTVDEEYTENTTEDVYETKQFFDQWLDILDKNGKFIKAIGWQDDFTQSQIDDMLLELPSSIEYPHAQATRKVRETKKS